ncbi:MAG: carboxypeptidase-like regulatory domain-containing protein [Daejeonella sp.]
MKLTALLLTLGCLQVNATAYSQRVTLSERHVPMEHVLELCFEGQPVRYAIVEKTIIVKPLEKSGMKLGVLADGSIKGKVSDSKGITLPGVTVKLEGGSSQTTSTDAQGNYSFPNVAPGTYTLVFTYLGFTRTTREVSLREGQQSSIDVSLVEKNKTVITANAKDYQVLYPIPQREIDLNKSMTQNPGW